MRVWHLVLKEILFRKMSFGVGLLSVATAVGCLVGSLTLLRIHDMETASLLEEMEQKTREDMDVMDHTVRSAMQELGFNIVILPKDQNLGDYFAEDFAAKTMPEQYMERLAEAGVATLEHMTASLRQKALWPEKKTSVIFLGVSDSGAAQLPKGAVGSFAVTSVPKGTLVLGHGVHQSLGLKAGERVRLMDKEFVVRECLKEHGSLDDDTVWLDLAEAQEILGLAGRINEILAVEKPEAWADLEKVEREIAGILPDTQVIEKASLAVSKRHARTKMAEEKQAMLDGEREKRRLLREDRAGFASGLVALVLLISGVWVSFLTFANARDRRMEVGLLRSLGFGSGQILQLFLFRSIIMGLVGGTVGFLLGGGLGSHFGEATWSMEWDLLGLALLVAVVLTGIVSFVPSFLASRQDPAIILQKE